MDDTFNRSAQVERGRGRKAAASARGDAMGELYCEVCGLKRHGRDECPECGAGPDARSLARDGDQFPLDLAEARKWVDGRFNLET